MSKKSLELVMSLFLFLLGGGIVFGAVGIGVWSPIGMASGFFPLVGGLLLSAMSVCNFVRALKDLEPTRGKLHLRDLVSIGGVVLVIAVYLSLIDVLGMFLPLPLVLVLLSLSVTWRIEVKYLLALFAGSVVFSIACYFVFKVGLKMLIPTGPFGF